MEHNGAATLTRSGQHRWLLPLEAMLIRFSASPVAFVAALLLSALFGLVVVQDWPGVLFCLLAPLFWLLGILLLRRRHLLQQAGLRRALEEDGLDACSAAQDAEHFCLIQATGSLPIPLVRRLYTGLTATVIVPHPTWVVLARLEGDVLPATWWRHEHYLTSVRECTEVYLREVSHVSVEQNRLVLHTSGGASIEVPADDRSEPDRAMDYLRRCLRQLAEAQGPDAENGPDTPPVEADS